MGKSVVGIFCFDGPLFKDCNGVYCSLTLTNEMFSRYFCVVDELVAIVRTFERDKTFEELNMIPLDTTNIKVIEVENYSNPKLFLRRRKFKKKIAKIVADADLLFARLPSVTSNLVLDVAHKIGKQYLVEVGGCAWDSYWNHGFLGKIVAPYMFVKEKINTRRASYASYVTEKFLQKRYPCNGVTTNASNVYLDLQSKTVFERRMEKIDSSDLRKIVVGQSVNSIDVKYKGEHLFIKAIPLLEKRGFNVEYQIVGPGTGDFLLREAKKYGVSDKVKLVGTLRKDEIGAWLERLDLYVQPSLQEGLPRSVLEAMNSSCPCIGSNIAGIPELLDNKCLFNPKKPNQIVDAISYAFSTKDNLKSIVRENGETITKFDKVLLEKKRNDLFEKYFKNVFSNDK